MTLLVDQSADVVRVTGADRIRFLQGMCIGNVEALPEGGWLRTATLNPKGRVLSIYDVVKRPDELLLITQPGLADATRALLERHAISDDVALERAAVAVHRVWDSPRAVWEAPPVFAPPPGPAADPAALEVRRIEAGLPLYGVDVSDESFPFETPLAALVDYKKGCYVGQEPVARVHARGQPARMLRGLRVSGAGPVAPGAAVAHPARAEAGAVTSAAESPAFGSIALAYLARVAWEPGGEVTVVAAGGARPARVVELPFARGD